MTNSKQTAPQQRFEAGDIVRYSDGVSALFRYSGTHNCDRLYGEHVLGGAHSAGDQIFFDLQPASAADLAWCRHKRPDWFSAAPAQDPIERARRQVIVAAIAWRCVPDRRDQEGIDAALADAVDRLVALAPE